MTTEAIHTCSYECERPGCIRAQRDELAARAEAQAQGGGEVDEVRLDLVPWLYVIRSEFLPDDDNLGRESDRKMREALDWAIASLPVHRTAPPSAPVGDSLVQTALRNLPQYISKSGLVGPDKHSAMQCFEVLRAALAQQPAAVDELPDCPHSALDGCDCYATQNQEQTHDRRD